MPRCGACLQITFTARQPAVCALGISGARQKRLHQLSPDDGRDSTPTGYAFGAGAGGTGRDDGSGPRDGKLKIVSRPLDRPFAGWAISTAVAPTRTVARRPARLGDAEDRGRGRFLGVMLHVWNPRGGWWGEGDEKLSTARNSSTSEPPGGLFRLRLAIRACSSGRSTQTMTMGNRHQSVSRRRRQRAVPTSFEATIEKYFRTEEGKGDLPDRLLVFAPGGLDLSAGSGRGSPRLLRSRSPCRRIRLLGDPPGNPRRRTWPTSRASGATGTSSADRALPGDKPEVALPVNTESTARVILTRATTPVRLSLDGKPLGEPIDLYNLTVIRTEPIRWGPSNWPAASTCSPPRSSARTTRPCRRTCSGSTRCFLRRWSSLRETRPPMHVRVPCPLQRDGPDADVPQLAGPRVFEIGRTELLRAVESPIARWRPRRHAAGPRAHVAGPGRAVRRPAAAPPDGELPRKVRVDVAIEHADGGDGLPRWTVYG